MDFDITAKVQLHIHLDGSVRLESVIPMAERRGITLPCMDYDELVKKVVMTKPENLTTFLDRFKYFSPAIMGDIPSIRQLAREFAEDMKADNVIYCESRFCPQLLTGDSLTADEVLEAVLEEFAAAEKALDIKLRVILCCIRGMRDIAMDVARLCVKYKDRGVVAIDIAGDESMVEKHGGTEKEQIEAFLWAKKHGVHRTAHAGENGSAAVVKEAVDVMGAERVGHGYHALDDADLYARLLRDRIHFETCPYSSIMTGSCSPDWSKHPVVRFARDDCNFSLNTDDPTITATTMHKEFEYAEDEMKVSKLRLLKTIFDAARSSFLPDDEKAELVKKLHAIYDDKVPAARDF